MNHRFDAQLLVQTQWPPFAVEIIFNGIEKMRTDSVSEFGVQLAASVVSSNLAAPTNKDTTIFECAGKPNLDNFVAVSCLKSQRFGL